MQIWAIGDLHLSFGIQDKKMDVFGSQWENHADQIAQNWKSLVHPEDLVLIPGDISWAMKLEDAMADLQWIDALPGTKVMIKGNHDYWWPSLTKLTAALPPSIHVIQNTAFHWKDVAIGGSRLWDTAEYSFNPVIQFQEPLSSAKPEIGIQEDLNQQIFDRELSRLQMSLKSMDPNAKIKIAMTHYPPIGLDLKNSRASQILEEHGVHVCVFGHLHNLKEGLSLFGTKNSIRYLLTSCDFLKFRPILVL